MVPVTELGSKIRGAPRSRRDIARQMFVGVEELGKAKPGSKEWAEREFNERLRNNASRTKMLNFARLTLDLLRKEPTDIKATTVYE